jgi:hypothetical protein
MGTILVFPLGRLSPLCAHKYDGTTRQVGPQVLIMFLDMACENHSEDDESTESVL